MSVDSETYRERPRLGLPILLFLLTVLTTVAAGAGFEDANLFNDLSGVLTDIAVLFKNPDMFLKGVPYSVFLLFILGTHEFGHYFASRIHGVNATFPYFIPGPPQLIGTFGAVIKMKSRITTRKALVDIGASGPIVGFISSLIVTAIGLKYSTLVAAPLSGTVVFGESLAYRAVQYLVIGPIPEGAMIDLHSVAFAGWLGFLITSLNLLPIGQLDGGHIVYAVVGGPAHKIISRVMVPVLVILGLLTWPGWLIWAVLVLIIGLWHPPVGGGRERLDGLRRGVSVASLAVFILTFMPSPIYIMP